MTRTPQPVVGEFLAEVRPAIDQELDRILPPAAAPPRRLHEAMRYSVFAGGKRLRPALCVAAYSVFRSDWSRSVRVAAAIELVHTYSLIHDDLPAMDDDDYRRGQLSCHRRFDEATAILAGDALLTLAFGALASEEAAVPETRVAVIRRLSACAGAGSGMIAGQMMDLDAEGRPVSPDELETIHRAKTGALFEASLVAGALLGGASEEEVEAIGGFGRQIGLAFQVRDDILDDTAGDDTAGTSMVGMADTVAGGDAVRGKTTYASLHGVNASSRAIERLTDSAQHSLERFGQEASLLVAMADYLGTRAS